MQLRHYSQESVEFDPTRTYRQHDHLYSHLKPTGLWLSVKGECDWPWWCTNEAGWDHVLRFTYQVELKPDANVLVMTTPQNLRDFHQEFSVEDEHYQRLQHMDWASGSFAERQKSIDWRVVAQRYDGLVIAPYIWSMRLDGPSWYYGFDCASGCIWNLAVIESWTPIAETHVCVTDEREGDEEAGLEGAASVER